MLFSVLSVVDFGLKLFHAQQEILQLKAKCDQCKDEMQSLKYELENALEEYAALSYRSKTVNHDFCFSLHSPWQSRYAV